MCDALPATHAERGWQCGLHCGVDSPQFCGRGCDQVLRGDARNWRRLVSRHLLFLEVYGLDASLYLVWMGFLAVARFAAGFGSTMETPVTRATYHALPFNKAFFFRVRRWTAKHAQSHPCTPIPPHPRTRPPHSHTRILAHSRTRTLAHSHTPHTQSLHDRCSALLTRVAID